MGGRLCMSVLVWLDIFELPVSIAVGGKNRRKKVCCSAKKNWPLVLNLNLYCCVHRTVCGKQKWWWCTRFLYQANGIIGTLL